MTTAAARDRSSDCANRGGGRFAREPASMRTSKVLRCGADRLHVWGESPWIAKTPTAAAWGSSEPRTGGARRRPLRGPAGPQEGRRRFLTCGDIKRTVCRKKGCIAERNDAAPAETEEA